MTLDAFPRLSRVGPRHPGLKRVLICAAGALAGSNLAMGADVQELLPQVSITASRVEEPNDQVPAFLTIIDGAELRRRGVTDLRGVVALVAGVEAAPGGDAGPASAVTSFWGLHEFDAFLLVVDGVPFGGAFNPAIATLDLNNVERIEVLRGAAPVTYGATSFVGVIQVIHYSAENTPKTASIGAGTHGSIRSTFSTPLEPMGIVSHSISIDAQRSRFSDSRERVDGGRVFYRASAPVEEGDLRVDANVVTLRQVPTSPVVRDGGALTTTTPLDQNYNPSDAKIREVRYQLLLGYSHPVGSGRWQSTASVAYSDITDIRGFLRAPPQDDGSSANADSQRQGRTILDLYLDTHASVAATPTVTLVVGADLLYGVGKQTSMNGEYDAPLAGSATLPSTRDLHVDEINAIDDRRTFAGQYIQAAWKPTGRLTIDGGLRLTEARERLSSSHLDGFDPTADAAAESSRYTHRLTGAFGSSYKVWVSGKDEVVPFASYRNTFKPAAQDFGPDYRPDVLKPESAVSYEVGVKGAALDGALSFGLEAFLLHFKNLVVTTTDAGGNPLVQNAGGERLAGTEAEFRASLARDLIVSGAISHHDARFTQYIGSEGGANVDASGKQLPMSPRVLASAGLLYSPPLGLDASLVVNVVGSRFLDIANQAPTARYSTVDMSAGYRWSRSGLKLTLNNLTNRRPPVSASEFGDQSYYLLPGRSAFLTYSIDL